MSTCLANLPHRSSTLGSIAWAEKFKLGPVPEYKISKTALNMLNKQYAMEFADAGFTFLLISPGVSFHMPCL
jgi:NAD(P)-dependent dehydrogenase (short-subunit alcohol dehydrogenase family)